MSEPIAARWIDHERMEWLAPDGTAARGSPAELAAALPAARCVLVAPGEAVTLTSARLPGRNRNTWQKAAPYMLEEGLAQDVESLHFALGPAGEDGEVPIAVASHEALLGWIEPCRAAGITVSAVVPAPLLLPLAPGSWSVLIDQDGCLVRTGPWSGFGADHAAVRPLIELALAGAGEDAPQALRVWGEADAVAGLGPALEPEAAPESPLALLARGLRPAPPLDLLQGPYGRKATVERWLRPWRLAAGLGALWLLGQAGLVAAEYASLRQEKAALAREMTQLFRDAVPSAQRVVNPRAQLEQRLRALQGGDAGEAALGFLDLLAGSGGPIAGVEGLEVRGLRYRSDRLDIDLAGGELEAFDALEDQLGRNAGVEVEMRTSVREGRVSAQVVLKGTST